MNEYLIPVKRLIELRNAVEGWAKSLAAPVVLQRVGNKDGKVVVRLIGKAPDAITDVCSLAALDQPFTAPEPEIHVGNELSEHVGEVKGKLELEVDLYHVIDWQGDFGLSYIHKMRDNAGNELVWFSSGMKYQDGRRYLLKGTVKEHSTYNDRYTGRDIKQTKLVRCKLTEPVQQEVTNDSLPLVKKKTKKTKEAETIVYKGETLELDEDGTGPF
jgi:hypothetical protein